MKRVGVKFAEIYSDAKCFVNKNRKNLDSSYWLVESIYMYAHPRT